MIQNVLKLEEKKMSKIVIFAHQKQEVTDQNDNSAFSCLFNTLVKSDSLVVELW